MSQPLRSGIPFETPAETLFQFDGHCSWSRVSFWSLVSNTQGENWARHCLYGGRRNAAGHRRPSLCPYPPVRGGRSAFPGRAAARAGLGRRAPSRRHPGHRPHPALQPLRGAPSRPPGVRWNALPVHARLQRPPRGFPARGGRGAHLPPPRLGAASRQVLHPRRGPRVR